MPNKQIFFDPERKRWKRLRRIIDITAVVSTLVLAGFIFNLLRNQQLPELLLPTPKHNYKALADRPALARNTKAPRPLRRKTDLKASLDTLQIPNKDQKEPLSIIESTRPQIVTQR